MYQHTLCLLLVAMAAALPFGTHTPYHKLDLSAHLPAFNPEHADSQVCTQPSKFIMLARHATRFPTLSNTGRILNELVPWIHANEMILEGSPLEHWHTDLTFDMEGELAYRGFEEANALGKGMREAYGQCMTNGSSYTPTNTWVQSSYKSRAVRTAQTTMHAFLSHDGHSLYPPSLGGYVPYTLFVNGTEDSLLRPWSQSPRYQHAISSIRIPMHGQFLCKDVRCNAFAEEHVPAVAAKIRAKIGVGNFSSSLTVALYEACIYDATLRRSPLPDGGACALFDLEDLLMFERMKDIYNYFNWGHGLLTLDSEVNLVHILAKPLLEQTTLALSDTSKANAHLYFAHAETILPILTALELIPDGQGMPSPAWNATNIIPMASRLVWTFYSDCNLLQLVYNDQPVYWQVNGSKTSFISRSVWEQRIAHILASEEMLDAPISPAFSPSEVLCIIFALMLAFTLIILWKRTHGELKPSSYVPWRSASIDSNASSKHL